MADKLKSISIWITGELVYGLIKIMWRGYTHWTMHLDPYGDWTFEHIAAEHICEYPSTEF